MKLSHWALWEINILYLMWIASGKTGLFPSSHLIHNMFNLLLEDFINTRRVFDLQYINKKAHRDRRWTSMYLYSFYYILELTTRETFFSSLSRIYWPLKPRAALLTLVSLISTIRQDPFKQEPDRKLQWVQHSNYVNKLVQDVARLVSPQHFLIHTSDCFRSVGAAHVVNSLVLVGIKPPTYCIQRDVLMLSMFQCYIYTIVKMTVQNTQVTVWFRFVLKILLNNWTVLFYENQYICENVALLQFNKTT